ncbi:hypothetical protein OS493_012463 [Desmophyllum pertusum]|uniref:Uncharacterized protein n=1 Tax=Desmophyllum pertusum TaxID=174260 RepID=A0A9W9ZS20_9CNID|nr:hypothetical protein OS493_012463 [Desmophyllum pertusum]
MPLKCYYDKIIEYLLSYFDINYVEGKLFFVINWPGYQLQMVSNPNIVSGIEGLCHLKRRNIYRHTRMYMEIGIQANEKCSIYFQKSCTYVAPATSYMVTDNVTNSCKRAEVYYMVIL